MSECTLTFFGRVGAGGDTSCQIKAVKSLFFFILQPSLDPSFSESCVDTIVFLHSLVTL